MSLNFIQQVKAQIDAQLPDNTSGLITPALLRGVLHNLVDSAYPRSASIFGSFPAGVAQALTPAPINVPALYSGQVNLDASVFTTDIVGGSITLLKTGFAMLVSISSLSNGLVNNDLRLQLYRNGVAELGCVAQSRTQGVAEPLRACYAETLLTGWAAGDVLTLRLLSVANASYNFFTLRLTARLMPTFSAV